MNDDTKNAAFYLAEGERIGQFGSWAFNAQGFEYWSAGLFHIYGMEPTDKAPSLPEYLAPVHPDDRDFVAQIIQNLLANKREFDFTKRIVRPDGAIRHIR